MGRYITVEVDCREALDELEDDDLREELRRRGIDENPFRDFMMEALAAARRGDAKEAATIIERILFPRFQSELHALEAYEKVMGVRK